MHQAESGKEATKSIPIREAVFEEVAIPMAMHLGAPSKPCVAVGDHVKMGQMIGEPVGALGLPVHASVSGTVTAIENRIQLGANRVQCVVIKNDFLDEWVEGLEGHGDVETVDPTLIPGIVKNAGICGMGGASFPTHVKLSIPEGKHCDTVILNGAECETHLTSDHRLMLEEPERVINGLRAVMRALNVSRGIIAVEDNKPDAIARLREVAKEREGIEIAVLKTKYPQGSEKQIIQSITGREVPQRGLPIDINVIVLNVGTSAAIADAVISGRPMIDRITTVTGRVNKPSNMRFRIGTLLRDAIFACDGFDGEPTKIILGGTMTGACAPNEEISIVKGSGGVVVLNRKEAEAFTESPCIRCGRCVATCPVGLNPYLLKRYCEAGDLKNAESSNIMDCILCGCCTFTCPARRFLTAIFKITKEKIAQSKKR